MPYIPEKQREILNPLVIPLVNQLNEGTDGDVAYAIFQIIYRVYSSRFANMAMGLGILEAVKIEYFRRVVAPYEQKKMEASGDVL